LVNPTFDALIDDDAQTTSEGNFSKNSTEYPGIEKYIVDAAPTTVEIPTVTIPEVSL